MDEEERWKHIKEIDFNDLGISKSGKNGIKVDLRLDGFHNYKYSNHLPCVYFRYNEGEYDFMPMIISNEPYIPCSYKHKIDNAIFSWVYSFVKSNKDLLLQYANEEIGYNTLFEMINKNGNNLNM